MFGNGGTVTKPDSPPNTPTDAAPSVLAAGMRAVGSARRANAQPYTSLIGAANGKLTRKGTLLGRTLLGSN